jgi:hypothetical protein
MRIVALICAAASVCLPAFALSASTPTPVHADALKCEPPLPVKPAPGLAEGSTYYNSGEPPKRFLVMPKGHIKVKFGRQAIEEECGVPPCGMRFLGCVRGDLMVLPDPSDPDFAKITRHELGHFNGWPATHGS